MTSPSDQAAVVAGTLRAKPTLLCAVLKELRDEKLAGAWQGEPNHEARLNPWTGMPVCAVWRDRTESPGAQWRWAVRLNDGSHGVCRSKERAKAAATLNLKNMGYTMTDWTEDDD